MNPSNNAYDAIIAEFSDATVKGDAGDHVKKLVDKVESLKFLRMQKMYENQEVLNELVQLTQRLRDAQEELDDYMRHWRHGA